jgi:hypothetical protein
MERRKSAGTIFSPQAVRTGLKYEAQVSLALAGIYGTDIIFQARVNKGIIDAVIPDRLRPIIFEIKLTQTEEGYHQLNRYASCFPYPAVRALVTRTVVRTIQTPERPVYLRTLESLRDAAPGYYIIPFSGS